MPFIMPPSRKGRSTTTALFLLIVGYLFFYQLWSGHAPWNYNGKPKPVLNPDARKDAIHMADSHQMHPVRSPIALPRNPSPLPRIQHEFEPESWAERKVRKQRQEAVKSEFLHAWNGYKNHAWLRDEVTPVGGKFEDSFSGWGATLVDSLDTLIIMGLDKELHLALEALEQIDFTTTFSAEVNVFEVVIRYMGGFLAAHDLTDGKYPILLQKAEELGDMIYHAFDTSNHMPQMRWRWSRTAIGMEIEPLINTNLAELGSLTLEFTRLTQLTNDPKYFDAVQRITNELDKHQLHTKIPGLWPTSIDALRMNFMGDDFTLGGGADSTYEYLPKEHIILGGQSDQYKNMYMRALEATKKNMLFRAVTKEDKKILFTSDLEIRRGSIIVKHTSNHLKCFLGGTVALAAKIFNRPQDLSIARGLTDGCVWAYDSMPTGIMPETFMYTPCADIENCPWDENQWYESVLQEPVEYHKRTVEAQQIIAKQGVPPGMAAANNPSYKLR